LVVERLPTPNVRAIYGNLRNKHSQPLITDNCPYILLIMRVANSLVPTFVAPAVWRSKS
jgi:hypothetical protein